VSSTFVPMYNMRVGSMGVSFGHFFSYALYGVICLLAALFVWKMVPETKGKSLEEMNKLWKERKKARKTT
ncbi:MAG: MFS transporter, partial [Bacteroidales bacterium]|nr:MFS transporter [Bacteroidales bacterium]